MLVKSTIKVVTALCCATVGKPNHTGTQSLTKNKGNTRKNINKKKQNNNTEYDNSTDKNKNLAKKIEDPGNPIVIKITKKDKYQRFGVLYHSPEICQKSRVPYRFEIYSTNKNSEVVVKQCATNKKFAKKVRLASPKK